MCASCVEFKPAFLRLLKTCVHLIVSNFVLHEKNLCKQKVLVSKHRNWFRCFRKHFTKNRCGISVQETLLHQETQHDCVSKAPSPALFHFGRKSQCVSVIQNELSTFNIDGCISGMKRKLFTQHEITKSWKTWHCYKYIKCESTPFVFSVLQFYSTVYCIQKNDIFSNSQFLVLVFRCLASIKPPQFTIQHKLQEVSVFCSKLEYFM